ncbi:transcriptional regulator [Rhodococcus sp. EPR-157]|nr:transcriptional regulator [Rhodococcus sp. EPR-157]
MEVVDVAVRIELLGPLRLLVEGETIDVPGPKRRAVLALLAFAAGEAVPVSRLVDALWPSEAPASGRSALQAHVSRLRRHLGAAATRLQSIGDGYRLELGRDECDVSEARAYLAQARNLQGRDPVGALALLEGAHSLWRGAQLTDLVDIADIATAIEEGRHLQREVTDALIDCAIDAGRASHVVVMATSQVGADPLREPSVLLAMRAMAAAGEAPEALRIGREFRVRLSEEEGLDPSPALGALEREIASGATSAARNAPVMARSPATRLIGRSDQVTALRRLMTTERLITLAGPGGVGKTRIALELANTADATMLTLAPLTDPAAIPHALAAALNVNVVHGDVLSACAAVLGGQASLLVVDNCEHLLDAARDTIAALLESCPNLSVLVTSREPLGLAAEYIWRMAPLTLPPSDPDSDDRERPVAPAVELFIDRAHRIRPELVLTQSHMRTIGVIVRHLDGLPLAIELAAGRLSTFSLNDLLERLDRALDLLSDGRPTPDIRHRTLRSTIGWSYELLEVHEQRLFRFLAVFPDGIDLADTEGLAADLSLPGDSGTALAHLVDASMINVEFGSARGTDTEGGTRYRILETVRAFGLDRSAIEGETDVAENMLLRWASRRASTIGAGLTTEQEHTADAALRREMPNLRAAWRLARDRGSLDIAVAIVSSLFDAIGYRDLIEIRQWAEELVADADLGNHPDAPVAFAAAAEAVYHRGDYQRAEQFSKVGLHHASDLQQTWHCLTTLSVTALARGEYADAIGYSLRATTITPRLAEPFGVAALAALYSGDLEEARRLNGEGRVGATWPTMASWNSYVAGEIENFAGNVMQAEKHYLRAIDSARRCGATFLVGVATVGLLTVRSTSGRIHEALLGYREVIDYFARTGNWTHLWAALRNLADLLNTLGDDESSALLHAAADHAPDSPAYGPRPASEPALVVTDRAELLGHARKAIDIQIAQVEARGRRG